MTDLTEYTWYYCKMKNGDIQMLERGSDYFLSGDVPLLNNEVKEVLAPVPSYDDWKQLKEYEQMVTSYNMKPIDYEMACETVNKLLDEKKGLKQENAQLKSLLKECRFLLGKTPYENMPQYFTFSAVMNRIDQALGEDK